jgi:hypothetical protein
MIELFLKPCPIYAFLDERNADPRTIFKSHHNTRCRFICRKCFHIVESEPARIEDNKDCTYCSPTNARTLCPSDKNCRQCFEKSFASNPKSECWDYSEGKNMSPCGKQLTPRDVFKAGSHPADFICNVCDHSFPMTCINVKTGYWCPFCRNKTEAKLKCFLDSDYPGMFQYQYKPKWLYNPATKCYSAFDFGDESEKLIIELDGDQHFYDIEAWKSSARENCILDIIKMQSAFSEGYSGIRLCQVDIWDDRLNWHSWINSAVAYIKSHPTPIWIFPDNKKYERHIDMCKRYNILYYILTPAPAAPPGTP